MANTWGGVRLSIDTANDDIAYTAANDALNDGVKYDTRSRWLHRIEVFGFGNGDKVELVMCNTGSIDAGVIFNRTWNTDDAKLLMVQTYNPPLPVSGILPKTIGTGCTVKIDTEPSY